MKTCSSCRRHLRRAERICRFCGAPCRDVTAPMVAVVSLASLFMGCARSDSDATTSEGSSSGTSAATSTTSTSSSTGGPASSSGPFAATALDGGEYTTDAMTSVGFIYGSPDVPSGGGGTFECDMFAQDCPQGEKCMPWANDGGPAWNGTRCSPIADSPGQVGEPCTVEGSGTSGIDDCDLALQCWAVDAESLTGTCVATCTGTEQDSQCGDLATDCAVANDGAIVLCLDACVPTEADCGPGRGCYPTLDAWVCAPEAFAGVGVQGDPCEFINDCSPGLVCASMQAVPGCEGGIGCCTEVCSLSDPAGDAQCLGAPRGQQCLAWDPPGALPPGYEDVGVCTADPAGAQPVTTDFTH